MLHTWARGVCCFYYHIGNLENLENTERQNTSFMSVLGNDDVSKYQVSGGIGLTTIKKLLLQRQLKEMEGWLNIDLVEFVLLK